MNFKGDPDTVYRIRNFHMQCILENMQGRSNINVEEIQTEEQESGI